MRVFNVYRGQDTGGWGYRIGQAFRNDPDWTFRSMYALNEWAYIDYPADLEWDRKTAQELYGQADVVHLHNGYRTARILERNVERKPAVVQYHGTLFRANPIPHLTEQRRRNDVGIVSTLDLWLLAPEDTLWLPSPYDLHRLRSLSSTSRSEPIPAAPAGPSSVPSTV